MNPIEPLQRYRADVSEPDAAGLRPVRDRVMASIHRPGLRTAPTARAAGRSRGWIVAAGTATVVTGLVVGGTLGLGLNTGTPANAAALLDQAAAAADGASAAIPAGSYLKITTRENAMVYVTDPVSGEYSGGYISPSTTTTWVPSSVDAEWVRRSEELAPATVIGGVDVAQAVAEQFAMVSVDERLNGITRAARGGFDAELGGTGASPDPRTEFAQLPTDPQRLLEYVRSVEPGEDDSDLSVLFWMSAKLRTGLVTPGLQASMYKAIALLPSVRVTERQADLGGRTGTSVGVDNGKGVLVELIIDPSTGTYIGQRETQTVAVGPIPAGTVVDWTTMSSELVSSAP